MKFESIALRSLFVSCLLICIFTVGRMLFVPHPVPAVQSAPEVATTAVAKSLPCPFVQSRKPCAARG